MTCKFSITFADESKDFYVEKSGHGSCQRAKRSWLVEVRPRKRFRKLLIGVFGTSVEKHCTKTTTVSSGDIHLLLQRFGKKFLPKLNHQYPPPPQKSDGQPHGGWGRNGYDTLVDVIRQQNGWRTFIMWWFSRLKCYILSLKNADKRNNWKEKVQKNAQVPFCGQTRTFRYEIVFRGILLCFLHGGSERLACFEPTDASRFLNKFKVHSVPHGQGKYIFHRKFLSL